MGIVVYEPPPTPSDEVLRERAVERSGALDARDDPVLVRLAREARLDFGTAMAAITIVYRDWQYLIAASGLPTGVYSRRTSFCGHTVAHSGALFSVPDASVDERFAGNPRVTEDEGVRFYAGAVIADRQGYPLGALCVFHPAPRGLLDRPSEERLLDLAAAAAARIVALQED